MSRNRITKAQAAILRLIANTVKRDGCPPTVREIGEHFGWSSPAAAAHGHLVRMRSKSLLTWREEMSRTIRLLPRGVEAVASDIASGDLSSSEHPAGGSDVS
jgi:repressor LexA